MRRDRQPCVGQIDSMKKICLRRGTHPLFRVPPPVGAVRSRPRQLPELHMTTISSTARPMSWRTPAVVIACGCAIAMLSFGPRSAVGQFLTPMSLEYHWGRDVFGFALAIQNLLWGAFQPFAGGIADRYGAVRVLWTGAIAYGAGLALMAYATSPLPARSHRRRADRLRAVELLVQSRDRRARQAGAGGVALVRVRRRHGGRIVRPVPVLAARPLPDRLDRLAEHAGHLRRHHAADPAARAGAGDAEGRRGGRRRRRRGRSSR